MVEQVGKDRRTDGRSNGRLKLGRAQREGTRRRWMGWEHEGRRGESEEGADRPLPGLSVRPSSLLFLETAQPPRTAAASPLSLSLNVSRRQEEGRGGEDDLLHAQVSVFALAKAVRVRSSVRPSVRSSPG